MTAEQISALSELWKPIAAITVLMALIFLRKPLAHFLSKFVRFRLKRGDREVEISTVSPFPVEPTDATPLTETPPKPSTLEVVEPEDSGLSIPPRTAAMGALFDRRFEEADRLMAEYIETIPDTGQRVREEASYNSVRFQHAHDRAAMERLQELAKGDQERCFVLREIAACHIRAHAFDRGSSGDRSRA